MSEPSSWFQQQLNDEARRIGKSATDRLALEIPTLPTQILQYFYHEHAIHMAASVISNRMFQYFIEQIAALQHRDLVTNGHKDINETNYQTHSLIDPETGQINVAKIYEDNENEVIESVIVFLKMELQNISQAAQEHERRVQPVSGGMGSSIIPR